jgi:hypothetical protein
MCCALFSGSLIVSLRLVKDRMGWRQLTFISALHGTAHVGSMRPGNMYEMLEQASPT